MRREKERTLRGFCRGWFILPTGVTRHEVWPPGRHEFFTWLFWYCPFVLQTKCDESRDSRGFSCTDEKSLRLFWRDDWRFSSWRVWSSWIEPDGSDFYEKKNTSCHNNETSDIFATLYETSAVYEPLEIFAIVFQIAPCLFELWRFPYLQSQ